MINLALGANTLLPTHRRIARRCSWCTCTTRGRKQIRCNLQAKFVSAPQHTNCSPKGEPESILGHFFAGRGRFGYLQTVFPSFEADD